jgi:hypothetical protein
MKTVLGLAIVLGLIAAFYVDCVGRGGRIISGL